MGSVQRIAYKEGRESVAGEFVGYIALSRSLTVPDRSWPEGTPDLGQFNTLVIEGNSI
jgi:hypothetical protein